MGSKVIALINWRPALQLKDNVRFVERAAAAGRVEPRDWRGGVAKYRSLTLRADGSCEAQTFSTAAAARRLGGVIARATARKARMGERG